ncbi:thioesterase superfamily protein [Parvibaculum lavamentivorans DS-1]|uniref:Thioesterase superfamily protein n=1 Tax=Parvibaculum lavamentivorans (strain DS-1 / DSM 13023 / NCIMB 13966) TaxID=402881 RepID=A7HSM9_PARL1|nr:PaaI family thioesterase [Parvibaculum lavamentivorans]ABS62912.1 thioesterase superfamily protein [Parvibaculum lavamentivorans DS-1]
MSESRTEAKGEWPPNIQAVFKRMAPASRYLGLEILEADREKRRVKVAFNASAELCNMWGGIQGGMVAAMLDDVMSLAVGLDLEWGQISPTLELKVSMLNAARPGRIIGTGHVIKRGKSVGFIEGELVDEDGKLLATGSSTATFVTLKKKPAPQEEAPQA